MKQMIGSAVCVVCALLIAAEGKDKEKKPEATIEGTWKVVSMVIDNKERKPADDLRIIFKRGTMIQKQGEQTSLAMRYKLDPTQKPPAIDLGFPGKAAGNKALGIYELKGDELKLCIPQDEQDRPTEFGPKRFLMYYTLKRDKSAESKSDAPKSEKSDKPSKD